MTSFVQLTVALEPSQAQPLVAALRAAGIEAYVHNEHLQSVMPNLRLALGGMPIYVRADQREAAEAFLARSQAAPVHDEALACPACGGATQLRRGAFTSISTLPTRCRGWQFLSRSKTIACMTCCSDTGPVSFGPKFP